MSDTATAAYLKAIEVLKRGGVRDQIDLAAIDAIDLDAICPTPHEGHPTHDNGIWSVRWDRRGGRTSASFMRAASLARCAPSSA